MKRDGADYRMLVRAVLSGGCVSYAVGEQIIVDFRSPMGDTNWTLWLHDNVAYENVTAVLEPNVGMKCAVYHNIILNCAVKSLP